MCQEGASLLNNLRKYGNTPYKVAVIHGGPGAPGDMASVARELAKDFGILEPLQTALSIEGQIHELHTILKENGELPVTLIGHSWGAWLSFIFANRYSSFVKKIILVASGPFKQKFVSNIYEKRISRLNKQEKEKQHTLTNAINDPKVSDKQKVFTEFGKLMSKADSYNANVKEDEILEYQHNVFLKVWKEADELRRTGELLEMGKLIECPVVAIHGDFDSHPCEGVEKPLSKIIRDFRFILLKNCGHYPWQERLAKDKFYDIIKREIRLEKGYYGKIKKNYEK